MVELLPTKCSKKVIIIAGTTGVGKSQLSIQLAKRFNGEVINSDSMQVYKDIPIITNKHPLKERDGISHHVMNHVDWTEEYYLHRFEKECLDAIDDIHSRGKTAIVVGGTHYYLQVLFNKHLDSQTRTPTQEENEILSSGDPKLVYKTLQTHDPLIANKFHPNDTRRVQRMLEIYYRTGKKPSEMYSEQVTQLIYDTLCLWLYSDPKPLETRLDERVDKMLENGGMEEIRQLHEFYKNKKYTMEQCENGVWQVIGFKEFLPWLNNDPNITLEECVDRMKIRTRQYAKKQVKWIKKMLIPDIEGSIYLLDASDLSQWDSMVKERSMKIAQEFVSNRSIEESFAPQRLEGLLARKVQPLRTADDWKQHTCSVCFDQEGNELIAIGEKNWKIHLNSRRHRSNSSRGSRKLAFEKWKAEQKSPNAGNRTNVEVNFS